MSHTVITIVFALLLIPGLIMAIVPGLPGLLFMLMVTLVFGLIDHFTHLTLGNLGILAAVAAVGMLLDLFSGIAGAKWGGAHWSSLLYGLGGLIIGTIAIPVPIIGSVAGLFLGILFAELYKTSNMKKARRAALGGVAGSVVGMAGNVVAGVALLALFVVFAWN